MTIQVGDHLPQVTFRVNGPDGPQAKTTDDLFKGRRVVLIGVPAPSPPPAIAITCRATSPTATRSCRAASTPSRSPRSTMCSC